VCLSQMSQTPRTRSRTTSRVGAPGSTVTRSSPSRLAVPPTLRPSPSLSNLHIHSHNTAVEIPPIPPHPQNSVLNSSASSVVNLDLNEGILLQDVDAEVDTVDSEDVTVMGLVDSSAGDEDSKKTLRDQLRNTLSHRPSRPGKLNLCTNSPEKVQLSQRV